MAVTEVKRAGRKPAVKPLTPAERQAKRRARDAKFGIEEVRGLRASATERAMLDALTKELGYGSRTEMMLCELRKVADNHGVSYRVKG